jgi:glycogen debranching enzyme
MTAFEERPHSPYYGSADATPLYVVLLDEYERWTGDLDLVRELEFEARAALNWIDEYADLQGNGYISYQRRNEQTGLENQCWKDSWDSISYHNGRLPGFPRASCELQGYAYDAKMRGARLARLAWGDPAYADKLEQQGADLKRRFNQEFWIEDGEFFALALDAEGRQVDSLTQTTATCCGAASSMMTKPRRLSTTSFVSACSPVGGFAPWPWAKVVTTQSDTTWEPSGPSTIPSSLGDFAATDSKMKPRS